MDAWITFLELCCEHYQVDKSFALAVAYIESGDPRNGAPLRFGRLGQGTYYGPFGIHKSFIKRWRIDDPYVNTWVGVRALRGKDKIKVLRRYNPAATQAYFRAVLEMERRLKREKEVRRKWLEKGN